MMDWEKAFKIAVGWVRDEYGPGYVPHFYEDKARDLIESLKDAQTTEGGNPHGTKAQEA